MTSLVGGAPLRMTPNELMTGFRGGLLPGKVSHHLARNYRIRVEGGRGEVWAHGYAWNRVPALPPAAISGRPGPTID